MNNDTNTLEHEQLEEIALSDDIVVSFLEDNPDFFNRNPSLLASLRIQDNQRGTVSLVERQQTLLRQKVHALEDEITELMSVANQNEQLFVLYSDLYLRLIDCQDGAELLDCLHQATTELLSLSDLKLWLTRPTELAHPVITTADCKGIVSDRLDNETYYFGRLQQKEQQLIFSETQTGSVVLIKLMHLDKTLGFLAISSQDADHFDPRMDTLLIGQFTRLIAKLIAKHLYSVG
ncbi:DUF484 family protein [Thalassotalea ganghwensis]